jgi:hypothetical protein
LRHGFLIKKLKRKSKPCFEVWKLKTAKDDIKMLLGICQNAADTLEILTRYRYLLTKPIY